MENSDIIIQAMAATTFAKVLVDITKRIIGTEARFLPLLAIVYGIMTAILLALASEAVINSKNAAIMILVGILAGGGAVGVTELQKTSNSNSPNKEEEI